MLIAIDPGAATGWALYRAGKLFACGLGDPRSNPKHLVTSSEDDADLIEDAWIERPVVYPRSPVPPNDIVTLALNAGEWGGTYRTLGVDVHYVEPSKWKGQVPKAIHHERIWAQLRCEEQDVISVGCRGIAPSKRHNVMDAVGLGLWALRLHAAR